MDMLLHDYLSEQGSLKKLADQLGISVPRVWQWKSGRRPVPPAFAIRVEEATSGAVSRQELRPKDHHLIWPELAKKKPLRSGKKAS